TGKLTGEACPADSLVFPLKDRPRRTPCGLFISPTGRPSVRSAFFCDRCILGPVPSSKTASQFYRVLNGPVLSLEPQQRRPPCRMKLRFARGATPSNAWPITG